MYYKEALVIQGQQEGASGGGITVPHVLFHLTHFDNACKPLFSAFLDRLSYSNYVIFSIVSPCWGFF